jgi:hypothetical protein
MKRLVVVLGILGLVYAVALPSASAGVLWQPDLSKGKLDPPAGSTLFTQGVNDATKGADDTTKNDPGIKPFVVLTDKDVDNVFDNSCSCNKGAGWLDNGDSDGTTTHDVATDATEKTYATMLLTGDPKWADVGMQCKMDVYNQNTGAWGIVLRATPKTKPDDPDSFYLFEYRSAGGSDASADVLLDAEVRDGIKGCGVPVKDRDNDTDEIVCVRIMKIVKGKWTMLAQQDAATSSVYIPRLNRQGVDHDVSTDPSNDGNGTDALTGYYFRFTAKGNVLTGYLSKDGKKFDQVLQATDNDLTAGQVGFFHYDYRPLTKEIEVDDTP